MDNKQTNDLENSSSPVLAAPYTVRISLTCLAVAVSGMMLSFIFGWMVKPAIWITLICIGAVYGMLLFDKMSKEDGSDKFQIIQNVTKSYSTLAIGIMVLPFFFSFSWVGVLANSIFLVCIGVIYSLFIVKRHLRTNQLKVDNADGFKYVECSTSGKVNWKKIRRITLVTVLIISPMYFFADYQRNHTEHMLKTKTSK